MLYLHTVNHYRKLFLYSQRIFLDQITFMKLIVAHIKLLILIPVNLNKHIWKSTLKKENGKMYYRVI